MPKYPKNMRNMISETIRRNINQAGIELIQEHGWGAFTTERIAEKAGMSRGVLYNYFENKEAIARSIIEESVAELNKQLWKAAKGKFPATLRLRTMSEILTGNFRKQQVLHRVFFENLPPPKSAEGPGSHPFAERNAVFQFVIEKGVADGEFAPVDPVAATALLTGALHEICMQSLFCNQIPDPGPVVDIFLKGIGK